MPARIPKKRNRTAERELDQDGRPIEPGDTVIEVRGKDVVIYTVQEKSLRRRIASPAGQKKGARG